MGSVDAAVMALQSLSAFFVMPALSHALTPREFGILATCVVSYQLLIVLISLGLGTSVALNVYGHEHEPEIARRLAGSAIITSLGLVGVAHLTGPLWSRILDGVPYTGAMTVAVVTCL